MKVMFIGSDFFNKVKDLGDISKFDFVCVCGYVFMKKDGGECLNFIVFYEVLLDVKGVSFGVGGVGGVGKGGCKFSYVVIV